MTKYNIRINDDRHHYMNIEQKEQAIMDKTQKIMDILETITALQSSLKLLKESDTEKMDEIKKRIKTLNRSNLNYRIEIRRINNLIQLYYNRKSVKEAFQTSIPIQERKKEEIASALDELQLIYESN